MSVQLHSDRLSVKWLLAFGKFQVACFASLCKLLRCEYFRFKVVMCDFVKILKAKKENVRKLFGSLFSSGEGCNWSSLFFLVNDKLSLYNFGETTSSITPIWSMICWEQVLSYLWSSTRTFVLWQDTFFNNSLLVTCTWCISFFLWIHFLFFFCHTFLP